MANGIALTIGLNAVDPEHYAGWDGTLRACEADANDMAKIAKSKKFQVKTLLTKEATRDNVSEQISTAAGDLKSGDIFMLSYSGHGGQLPDLNQDELDDKDETWCLYDGQLVDDEINSMFAKFSAGVRILVFSDSCHSGTVSRAIYYETKPKPKDASGEEISYRYMPIDYIIPVYKQNQEFYDEILRQPFVKDEEIKASALLLSGCQDEQFSQDGLVNGLFTSKLLIVWNNGKFVGNYKRFWKMINSRMPADQISNYYPTGIRNYKFEYQMPFTV